MKMLRKIGLATLAVGAAVAAFWYFTSYGSRTSKRSSFDPAFATYISSYTAGVISSGSPLRIMLASPAVDSLSIGTEPLARLFTLSPAVKGKAVWVDTRTVEFRPEQRLASGQIYTIAFALGKVMDVPQAQQTFEFSVQTIPQNFEVSVHNIRPYTKTDLKRQKVEGLLYTADFAESAAVEQMMKAHQQTNTLRITWEHSADGRQHGFAIEEVARQEAATSVQIEVTGQPLRVERNESREVEIPALGDFRVTNVRVEQGGSQHVVVQFSDPLSENQNLQGLLSIANLSSLEFEIKDNEIRVYPPVKQTGSRTLRVEAGIRNVLNYRMAKSETFEVAFEQIKPQVRFTGKGNILPGTDGWVLPFEAVNLKAVDVRVIRIFENNIHQFFQVNDWEGSQEIRRVGKVVWHKRVMLDNMGVSDLGKWNRFTLDLAQPLQPEPGALYQVQVAFRRAYLAYDCEGASVPLDENASLEDSRDDDVERSYWDSYDDDYYDDYYNWSEREDPCTPSYYTGDRFVKRLIHATDIGLIAKQGGDGTTLVFVTDIRTSQPIGGATVELFDYQQQVLSTATTDPQGKALLKSTRKPFLLIARQGAQRGYLKLQDGRSLSLSSFDIAGETVQKGLKSLLYGERGVWRPGDSLFLTFLLEDKFKLLPAHHPVIFELHNPNGALTQRLVRTQSANGFYSFATRTEADAPTGTWLAKLKVGGADFTYPLKVEMVKPNRLKINLDFGTDRLREGQENLSGRLHVKWLHGAPGKRLKAQFEVTLSPSVTKFDKWNDYVFDDPSRSFSSETHTVFEGTTDDEGNQTVHASLPVTGEAPGMLNAVFRGKVFEESGNFSLDRFTIPYYPYSSFVGVRLPQGDKARGMLLTDTTHRVEIATLDADGTPLSRNQIEMSLYKVNWRWWWDQSAEGDVNFMSGSYAQPIAVGKVNTVNGKGVWTFKVKYPEWGRFFVRAHDPVSGHSSGKIVYIDWPGWAGRARKEAEGATMLSFSSDKPAYSIGEKAILTIPAAQQGRALVSIENGSRVLASYWIDTKAGDNLFTFDVTREMTPNVFAHVTTLQPHAQTVNDMPLRMYGVIPLAVEDPSTRLEPVISMPDVLEPGQRVTIKISEKQKRKMTYTVALVDEGLLDLTRFRTPDPWRRFYAREALGVKTWDMFDDVLGAHGGRLERLLAIGGGDELEKPEDAKANRFKPVVRFFGPFTLSGNSQDHSFIMPSYVGSVKTMVVAGYEGAYGSAEKVTPVRKPLMVLATLPRVLGPEETVKLPVTVFALERSIRQVKLELKVTGPAQLRESVRTISLQDAEQTAYFDLSVLAQTGVIRLEVTASSGNDKATDQIELQVRNPNPPVTRVADVLVEAGQTTNLSVALFGLAGTNTALLEVSTLPPLNLGQRLRYLMQYPHGCVEQTTSAVFPQLYLALLKSLSDEEKATVQRNVRAGIERLRSFSQPDGGFSYWPGSESSDSWGTSYAGHFLLEAEASGYWVPADVLTRWRKHQKERAQSWRKSQEYSSSELIQAYRLYTLALAGHAELGAMNRLREMGNLPASARWMLALAYLKAGQTEAAQTLINQLPTQIKPYQEMSYSYGSDLRDKAVILEVLVQMKDRTRAFEVLRDISKSLSDVNYYGSTQTLAWCLKAASSFAGGQQQGEVKFTYQYRNKEVKAATQLPVVQVPLAVGDGKEESLRLTSQNQGPLFARVILEGTPPRGSEEDAENNLRLSIAYTDTKGFPIDPLRLDQGTEFVASVTVTNPGLRGNYQNLALTQIFPSGWEISNLRLEEAENRLTGDRPSYQDIRDDRVLTYFDLAANRTKTFKVLLTASYGGAFYLPAVSCEAMYDRTVYARKRGAVVEVVRSSAQ